MQTLALPHRDRKNIFRRPSTQIKRILMIKKKMVKHHQNHVDYTNDIWELFNKFQVKEIFCIMTRNMIKYSIVMLQIKH